MGEADGRGCVSLSSGYCRACAVSLDPLVQKASDDAQLRSNGATASGMRGSRSGGKLYRKSLHSIVDARHYSYSCSISILKDHAGRMRTARRM